MKKKIVIPIIVCILVLPFLIQALILLLTPKTEAYKQYKPYHSHFGSLFQYNTINHIPTEEEKECSDVLMDELYSAFSYKGPKEECPYNQTLKTLCHFTEDRPWDSCKIVIDRITFLDREKTGYLWVVASSYYTDEAGNEFGGGPAPMLIKYTDDHGTWVAKRIYQVP